MWLRSTTTYKYDVRLSLVLEAGRSSTPTGPTLARCLSAGPDDLTDEHVRHVVERWRQVIALHDLYCDPDVQADYRRRDRQCGLARHCQHHRASSGRPLRHAPADDGARALSDRAPGAAPDASALAAQQRGRFYRALMAYWLAVEARHLASVSCLTSLTCMSWNVGLVERLWSGSGERTLLEAMDVLEVYDFVYDYLLRRAMPLLVRHATPLVDTGQGSGASSDECLLRFARLRLRPPALAELFGRDPRGSGACHFPVELSVAFQKTACVLADWRYPVRLLEQAVEARLRRSGLLPGGHALANVWTCYRNHWAAHNRGRLFTKALRCEDVIRDIECYAAGAECLARHPHFVRLSRRDLGYRPRAIDR